MTMVRLLPLPLMATPASDIAPFAAAQPLDARAMIADFAEKLLDAGHAALALLDHLDGDPDLEAEPDDEEDDPQGACNEDEISTASGNPRWGAGAGCPISDPGEGPGREWLP